MKHKIPLEKVKQDMNDPRYYISQYAKDYYYREYATEEERKEIDRENKINSIIKGTIMGIITLIALWRLVELFI